MIILYILVGAVAVVLLGASLCAVFKPGANDNICNYDHVEREKEQ